jgi:hypothetical protein
VGRDRTAVKGDYIGVVAVAQKLELAQDLLMCLLVAAQVDGLPATRAAADRQGPRTTAPPRVSLRTL